MTSITVFTYGDPDPRTATAIGAYLTGSASGAGGTILGRSEGRGAWGDEPETCGSLVVSGLPRSFAVRIASHTADVYRQDAVGVLHNDEGRTLATPADCFELHTADEVWS